MAKRYGNGAVKSVKRWWKRVKKAYPVKRYRLSFYVFAKKQNLKVWAVTYFRGRRVFYYTLVYFSIATAVAAFSQLFFADFKADTVFSFFMAAGGMTGGMLAIIFTLNTLLVNFALTQYPPQFFKLSGYDKNQDKIYFAVAALAAGLFIMGFMYPEQAGAWQYWLMFSGLSAIFAVFYLIFVSYSLTRQRLNPMVSFKYITEPAFDELDKCEKDARRLADMLRKDPKLADDKKRAADQQPHMLLRSRYENVNAFIGVLYDYHDKLVEKKDYSAALDVLDAIAGIIVRYIEVRKDSFVLLPSGYLTVPITDAQDFFDANFQRLVDRAKVYIRLGNQNGSRKVISLFEVIGGHLSSLEFPRIFSDNPPFAQCVGYLGTISDDAIKQDDVEATFRAARAYAVLGTIAITKRYVFVASTVYEGALKLAFYAGGKKQSAVHGQVAEAFTAFAQAFARRGDGHTVFSTDLHSYFDELSTFLWYYAAMNGPAEDYKPNRVEETIKPLKVIVVWMRELAKSGSNFRNAERETVQRQAVELGERLRRLLRQLSDRKGVSLSNRFLGSELANIIQSACFILMVSAFKRGWERNAEGALQQASWLVHQISFFTSNAPDKMDVHRLDELSNVATTIGLYALHRGNGDLAIDAIKVNLSLAKTCLEKATQSADYEAPRIMANACLIALLTLQRQNDEVLKKCKEAVTEFNAAYAKKFFPNGLGFDPRGGVFMGPYPQQLFSELQHMARERFGPSGEYGRSSMELLDRPEDYLVRLEPGINVTHYRALLKYLKRGK